MSRSFPALRRAAVAAVACTALALPLAAGETRTIPLEKPSVKRGPSVMEALASRASCREWDARDLAAQDLSDLLWAANGMNRPASGKRTAPSAMNAQDVDVYAFTKEGAYLYDARAHALKPVAPGDLRAEVSSPVRGRPGSAKEPAPPPPPVLLVLVSDTARFPSGDPALRAEWAAFDAGVVSENVSLFCAAASLVTVPRAGMDKNRVHEVLKLKESQVPMLNHPVGYPVSR